MQHCDFPSFSIPGNHGHYHRGCPRRLFQLCALRIHVQVEDLAELPKHKAHVAVRKASVAAEHLDGTTPTTERAAILGRLETGTTRVVVNVGVLCEGWDQPSVKCCVLARP